MRVGGDKDDGVGDRVGNGWWWVVVMMVVKYILKSLTVLP